MTQHFATSFDNEKFLLRGLALYRSLEMTCHDFILWNLCMDEASYEILSKLCLKNIRLIRVDDIEDEQLLAVKNKRSLREYSITCKSFFLSYLLESCSNIKQISWVDADLYFFKSPEIIFEQNPSSSIIICNHNFSPDLHGQEKTSGIYNAGFVSFKNNADARNCLTWWKERCIEWCKGYYEDGKLGEQMYMDQFPILFNGVCVSNNPGINSAYWNISPYGIKTKKSDTPSEDTYIFLRDKRTNIQYPLIFYHFSGVKFYNLIGRIACLYDRRHMYPSVKTIYNRYAQGLNWGYNIIRIKKIAIPDKWLESNLYKYMWKKTVKVILSYIHYFD